MLKTEGSCQAFNSHHIHKMTIWQTESNCWQDCGACARLVRRDSHVGKTRPAARHTAEASKPLLQPGRLAEQRHLKGHMPCQCHG